MVSHFCLGWPRTLIHLSPPLAQLEFQIRTTIPDLFV
jgi:hypothetical protein